MKFGIWFQLNHKFYYKIYFTFLNNLVLKIICCKLSQFVTGWQSFAVVKYHFQKIFIWLKDSYRKIFHPLVYSPNGQNGCGSEPGCGWPGPSFQAILCCHRCGRAARTRANGPRRGTGITVGSLTHCATMLALKSAVVSGIITTDSAGISGLHG